MAEDKTEAPKVQLDPTMVLLERTQLTDIKERASLGRAQMIEDYLLNRVLVLSTQNSELMAANVAMAEQLAAQEEIEQHRTMLMRTNQRMTQTIEELEAELAQYRPAPEVESAAEVTGT